MSYLRQIMEEEYERLQALSQKYSDKIASFPKGSISIKKRNKGEYLYLARRQGGKVKFIYIAPVNSEKAVEVMKQVDLRKNYELKLKQVKQDLKKIGKVVNGRKI